VNATFSSEDYERIDAHRHLTAAAFALKFPGRNELAELFDCYQRAPKKYPTWHGNGLVYTRTALEQSSGEAAALFKASLISGGQLIDLTGGLGIDTFAFSRRFSNVLHIERDEALQAIARHNHQVMGANNVSYLMADATHVLDSLPPADAAFIDPSRRVGKGRAIRLQDCEPDLSAFAPDLLQRFPTVLAKLSPLFDLAEIPKQLPNVSDIHVISVAGEVKEILVLMRAGHHETPMHHAVGLLPNGAQKFLLSGKPTPSPSAHHSPQLTCFVCDSKSITASECVLLPDAAVLKAGLSHHILQESNAQRIDTHSLMGIATSHPAQFPGRVLPIRWEAPWKPKELVKRLKQDGIRSAQILTKGVENKEPDILKDLGLKHGNDAWIVVCKL
jgi:hypothetical protein